MTPGAAREDAARVRRAEPDDADAVWPLTQLLATSFTPDHERFAVGFTDLVSREDTYLGVAEGEAGASAPAGRTSPPGRR